MQHGDMHFGIPPCHVMPQHVSHNMHSHNILRGTMRHHARHTWHTSRIQVLHMHLHSRSATTCTHTEPTHGTHTLTQPLPHHVCIHNMSLTPAPTCIQTAPTCITHAHMHAQDTCHTLAHKMSRVMSHMHSHRAYTWYTHSYTTSAAPCMHMHMYVLA